HTNPANAVALTPDGRLAVSGGPDQTVRVWDLLAGLIPGGAGHAEILNRLTQTTDEQPKTPAGRSPFLSLAALISDLLPGGGSRSPGHAEFMVRVAWTAASRKALSAGRIPILCLWDVASGACEQILRGHLAGSLAVAWTPEGQRAVSAGGDGTLKVWDVP